jgi:hypothetical protein
MDEIDDNPNGNLHPPVPHACQDPGTHRGPYRQVGPLEWDQGYEADERGWAYSRGWSRRYPEVASDG